MKQISRECWVLLANRVPIGVFTDKRTAIIERLRLDKEQDDDNKTPKLRYTLSDAVTLVDRG